MLNAVRWFTQRITLMIVIPPCFLVIPWELVLLGQATGLLGWIDGFYGGSIAPPGWDRPLFWLAIVTSRSAFAFG